MLIITTPEKAITLSLEAASLEPFVFAVLDLTKDLEKQIKNMANQIGTDVFLIRSRYLGCVFLPYYSRDIADFLSKKVIEHLSKTTPQPKNKPICKQAR